MSKEFEKDFVQAYLYRRVELLQKAVADLKAENARLECNAEMLKIEVMKTHTLELCKRWRTAEKELPPRGVLVWCESFGRKCAAAFYDEDGDWWTEDHKKMHVQYWQFLPLPMGGDE